MGYRKPSPYKKLIEIDGLAKINLPSNYAILDEDIQEEFKIKISDLIVQCLEDNGIPDMSDSIMSRAIKKYELVEEYEICHILKYSLNKYKKKYESRFV